MSNPYRPVRLPIKDGSVIRIRVDKDHIGGGCPCSGDQCAVSLAVIEHFSLLYPGTRWEVSTNERSVWVRECDSGEDQWTYRHNAEKFIEAYDTWGQYPNAPKPAPFALELYP